jgi:hypothetical protein
MHASQMKRLLQIFELSKNEQRVVLIVMFVLIAVGFIGYERRLHSVPLRPPAQPEAKTTPRPAQTEEAQGVYSSTRPGIRP